MQICTECYAPVGQHDKFCSTNIGFADSDLTADDRKGLK